MAVQLSTIRNLVRGYLDESSAADWTDSELNALINQRYHRVATAVITTFEDYYMTTVSFNTVASQEEYGSSDGVPTDIFKIRRVEVNYDTSISNNPRTRCLPINNIDQIRRDLAFQGSGTTLSTTNLGGYYTFGHGSNIKIGLVPIPDKNGTNATKIWYIKQLSDLSSDSSTIDIPYAERYWHVIAEGTTSDALRFGQQASKEADKFDQKFISGVLLMQEELESKITEDSKSVMDVSSDVLDFRIV